MNNRFGDQVDNTRTPKFMTKETGIAVRRVESRFGFTPENLSDASDAINQERLRLAEISVLGSAPEAEEFFNLAMAHLQQASSMLRLAQYAQSRALVEGRR